MNSLARRSWLPVALATAVIAVPAAAQQGPPGDGDVRSWRDGITNDRYASLTLMLRNPKGPLPINLVLTIMEPWRPKPGATQEIKLEFLMPLLAGTLDFKPPHVTFVVDRNQATERIEAFSVEPTAAMEGVDHVIVQFDAARLQRFAKASTIDGKLLGVEFVLMARQLRSIQDFARSELRAGR